MNKELRKKLGIDEWLDLVKEDKNLNGAYISFAQYMYSLEQEVDALKQTHDYDLKMIDEVKGNSVELFQENKQLKEQLNQEKDDFKELVKLDDKELKESINNLKGTEFLDAFCVLQWINTTRKENQQLANQNEELKQKLNWIAFGDEPELALRYLRKIGYVDFDEERKVYINKHNNEPFWLDDEEEKTYFIEDEEINEYTKQLEQENQQLKEKLLEETKNNYKLQDELSKKTKEYQETYKDVREEIKDYKKQLNQRDKVIKEAIDWVIKYTQDWTGDEVEEDMLKLLEILQKYKGDNNG